MLKDTGLKNIAAIYLGVLLKFIAKYFTIVVVANYTVCYLKTDWNPLELFYIPITTVDKKLKTNGKWCDIKKWLGKQRALFFKLILLYSLGRRHFLELWIIVYLIIYYLMQVTYEIFELKGNSMHIILT